jgi:hypothetical protein
MREFIPVRNRAFAAGFREYLDSGLRCRLGWFAPADSGSRFREARLIRAAVLAILTVLAAGAAEAQVRDRLGRIDRIDKVTRMDRLARAAETDRQAQRALAERREQQALDQQQQSRENPLLADQRLAQTRDGFPARRGEILALDLSAAARQAALAAGMTVISETTLGAGQSRLARLNAPAPLDPGAMLDLLRAADPQGVFDFNHAFATSGPMPAPQSVAPAQGQVRVTSTYVIGMIDGGVLASHSDLQRAAVSQRAFPESSGIAPTDHGTAVAGRLAETMAAPFDLVVADVLTGTATSWTGADALAEGLAWLTSAGVKVVNISLAGPPNAVVQRMVARHITAGGDIVAAVGNGGPFSGMIYPAAYPGVVGVTAIDAAGRVYALASTGSHVDVSAPGVDVSVAALSGRTTVSGTSYAAPVIAAQTCLKACSFTPTLAAAH